MSFSEYKSLKDVKRVFGLKETKVPIYFEKNFHHELEEADMRFLLKIYEVHDKAMKSGLTENEQSIATGIIATTLNFCVSRYTQLSSQPQKALSDPSDKTLNGFPDWSIGRWDDDLGEMDAGLIFVEAKRQAYDEAEGQCLAAMYARSNVSGEVTYGIVSSGMVWRFFYFDPNDKRIYYDPHQYSLDTIAISYFSKVVFILMGLLDKLAEVC